MSASEQTSASKRRPGAYWVKFRGNWRAFHYAYNNSLNEWGWEPHSSSRALLTDDDFQEIDERRIERPLDTEPTRFDIVKAMADQLGVGQPDELSKAEDVQLLKQQRIHDMNRISDLETTLKAHPDKLSTYFYLVQARRELSKAQERIAELESENRDLRKLTDELLKGHE